MEFLLNNRFRKELDSKDGKLYFTKGSQSKAQNQDTDRQKRPKTGTILIIYKRAETRTKQLQRLKEMRDEIQRDKKRLVSTQEVRFHIVRVL